MGSLSPFHLHRCVELKGQDDGLQRLDNCHRKVSRPLTSPSLEKAAGNGKCSQGEMTRRVTTVVVIGACRDGTCLESLSLLGRINLRYRSWCRGK